MRMRRLIRTRLVDGTKLIIMCIYVYVILCVRKKEEERVCQIKDPTTGTDWAFECSWETRISRFLLKYRITPHTTKGRSPAELLLGRQPKSRLDLLHPDTNAKVLESQSSQKYGHDKHARARGFQVGERVYLQNFSGAPTWLTGKVLYPIGPVSFRVQLPDDQVKKQHVDHLRIRYPEDSPIPLPPFRSRYPYRNRPRRSQTTRSPGLLSRTISEISCTS